MMKITKLKDLKKFLDTLTEKQLSRDIVFFQYGDPEFQEMTIVTLDEDLIVNDGFLVRKGEMLSMQYTEQEIAHLPVYAMAGEQFLQLD